MAVKKSASQIKSDLKKLKKSGLIKLDLRKITDKTLSNKNERNSLLRSINKFSDILKGKASVVKVSDKKAREALASRGHRLKKGGLVIISKKVDETVKATKSGNLTFMRTVKDRKSNKLKTEVIHEPNINFKDVQSIEDAVNLYAEMYSKGKGDKISFTYYGNISKRTYTDVREAILQIISYTQPQNEISTSLNPADIPEIMKSVQILSYIDHGNYGRARAEILDNKAKFNKYFKKLPQKRAKK